MTTHLITFPDWTQPENLLYQDLVNLIKKVANFENTNLLIDITGITREEAELIFSSIITSLTLEEDLEISDSLELNFIGNLSQQDWESIKSNLHSRINLNCDQKLVAIDNQYYCPICQNHLINFLSLPQFFLTNLTKYK